MFVISCKIYDTHIIFVYFVVLIFMKAVGLSQHQNDGGQFLYWLAPVSFTLSRTLSAILQGMNVCLCTGNPVRVQRKATGSTEENISVVRFEIHSSYITNTDHHPLSKSWKGSQWTTPPPISIHLILKAVCVLGKSEGVDDEQM